MGFQPSIRLAPEYFDAIKGKSDNHITPPVKTQFGYHIIKVMSVKNVKSINNALYKKIVYDQKRDAILESYFAELRAKSNVKINKEFLK
jgi:peptidyl-prolyl cis-trans isomerase C